MILAARSTLRNLGEIKPVLAGLSTSREEIVKEIKERIRPFEFGMGLSSLPDEMLSKIFEHTLEWKRSGRHLKGKMVPHMSTVHASRSQHPASLVASQVLRSDVIRTHLLEEEKIRRLIN